jgi:hypothetical protein
VPRIDLDAEDKADLMRFLREAIERDRYPLSPRVKRLMALLAKLDPAPTARCRGRRHQAGW